MGEIFLQVALGIDLEADGIFPCGFELLAGGELFDRIGFLNLNNIDFVAFIKTA
jgi:hypothetical protein